MKTSELTGAALDWAVAKCEGEVTDLLFDGVVWGFKLDGQQKVLAKGWAQSMMYLPSTDWAQGGPIIEREKIATLPPVVKRIGKERHALPVDYWRALAQIDENEPAIHASGPTPLIAAMRCYCCSKLGDEIDIPEELCQSQNS